MNKYPETKTVIEIATREIYLALPDMVRYLVKRLTSREIWLKRHAERSERRIDEMQTKRDNLVQQLETLNVEIEHQINWHERDLSELETVRRQIRQLTDPDNEVQTRKQVKSVLLPDLQERSIGHLD